MDVQKAAPALLPAAAWLAGLLWVFELGSPPILLAALGLAASLAFGGRPGSLPPAAFFAALLLGAVQAGGPDLLASLAGRNLEVRGRALGHADGQGERVFLLETTSLRVGEQVYPLEADLLVVLGREDGEGMLAVGWGDRLVLRGSLQAPAEPRNGAAGWPGLYRLRVKSERLAERAEPGGSFDRLAAGLRQRAERSLAAWPADERAAGFLRCLVLGDRSRLPDEWARAFNAVGLGHALSVSGFHVSLIFLICWGLTSFFPYRLRWLRLLLIGLLLLAYLLLVGPRPAALRAGLMGLALLAALLLERPALALNSLALAAFLLTLERPQLVADLGFQLSVLATFGIAASSLWVGAHAGPGKRLLAASFGAELMTLPLLLPRTCLWHPLGFLCNLAAGPWLGLLIAVGCLYLLAAELVPPLAPLLAGAFVFLCRPLDWLAELLPSRLFSLPVPDPNWWAWLVPAAVALLLLFPRPARWILLAGLLLTCSGVPAQQERRLEAVFIDVGQGDATVLIDGEEALLVDGGGWRRGDPAARLLIPALVRLGVGKISAIAVSHGDLDHCGGLRALLSYWPVAELWASEATATAGCGRELRENTPRFRPLAAGDRLEFGRWTIEVLWPRAAEHAARAGNDDSLVLLARAGGRSLLLTGDIEKRAELGLLRQGPERLAAEVLKVAHHGSRSSSLESFVAAVGARWAIVSAGEGNHYGHPAPEVVARLERDGACRVLRTDRHGLVRLQWPQAGRPWRLELPAMPNRMPG
jgi:competence protein ComEC